MALALLTHKMSGLEKNNLTEASAVIVPLIIDAPFLVFRDQKLRCDMMNRDHMMN